MAVLDPRTRAHDIESLMNPYRSSRVARTMATTFEIQALGLVSGILVARLLGVHGRGLLATVILVPNLLAYLGDLGGPVAYAYLVATRRESAAALLRNAVALALGQSIVLALLGVPIVLFALRNDPAIKGVELLFLFGF